MNAATETFAALSLPVIASTVMAAYRERAATFTTISIRSMVDGEILNGIHADPYGEVEYDTFWSCGVYGTVTAVDGMTVVTTKRDGRARTWTIEGKTTGGGIFLRMRD
jgi:hypothetical protein